MKHGQALACADLLGLGESQIVVGLRMSNANKKVGVNICVPMDQEFRK